MYGFMLLNSYPCSLWQVNNSLIREEKRSSNR
jgi:hypothetical protein